MKKTIYLYQSGELSRKDNSLALKQKNNIIYLPIEQIDNIICFSEITLNKRVLSLLNKYRITLIFFNFYGDYIGRFTPKQYVNGKVLFLQTEAYQNDKIRLYIAKQMLEASFNNMLAFLKYYNKKGFDLKRHIQTITNDKTNLIKCKTINSMMLCEAKIKQCYYSSFDIILCKEEYSFIKRSINPPLNEFNAMLSYGYSILYSLVLAVLDRSSLHPQISFIHSLSKSYDSLQYDISDIYKPVLIDRLVCRLIRKKQVKDSYFEKKENRCYLNKEGVSFYIKELEMQLTATISYKNKNYSYRSMISREVHELSDYIKGNKEKYMPYVMKW